MISKPKLALSLLCLVTFSVIAADAGLDLFNSKKSQVQNNQVSRATSSNSGTGSVGTGSHWEQAVQDEIKNYSPDTSTLEDKIRTEFTNADSQLKSSVSSTNSQLAQFKSTTSSNLSSLGSSIDSKLNSLKNSTNTTISNLNSKATQLSGSVSSADTKIAQLKARLDALQVKLDAAGACSSWETIYDGPGTTTITLPSGWSKYRVSYSYTGSTMDSPYYFEDRSDVDLEGDYGDTFGGYGEGQSVTPCTLMSNAGPMIAFVNNRESLVAGTISWDADVEKSITHFECPTDPPSKAYVRDFKITKFEIFKG